MNSAMLSAKMSGMCTRPYCFEPAADDSCMCRHHADAAAARVRKSSTKLRAARRALGQCAACGRDSTTYRCDDCKAGRGRRQTEMRLEVTHGND